MNHNTQACKSPDTKDNINDDKEEEHNEKGKVEGDEALVEETGRERLKRHREEVMGRVKIPENWGQEKLLNEWIDCTTFDGLFAPHRMIVAARDALAADGRKARSQRLRIHSSC